MNSTLEQYCWVVVILLFFLHHRLLRFLGDTLLKEMKAATARDARIAALEQEVRRLGGGHLIRSDSLEWKRNWEEEEGDL